MLYTHAPARAPRSCSYDELCRRLDGLRHERLPQASAADAICIGLADARGEIVHVVRTLRLVEALKVVELLVNAGWVPVQDRSAIGDEDGLMRVYRRPVRDTA